MLAIVIQIASILLLSFLAPNGSIPVGWQLKNDPHQSSFLSTHVRNGNLSLFVSKFCNHLWNTIDNLASV